jgi:hypothetical protein
MGFLSGLAKGLHRAFDGTNLAMVQALLAGDHQGAAAIRARQDELQRQTELGDAQVIAAKNLGFSQDEIDAMRGQPLAWEARRRVAMRGLAGASEGEDGGEAAPLGAGAAALDKPGDFMPRYAPPPGRPEPDASFTQASARAFGGPGFGNGASPMSGVPRHPAVSAPRWGQMAALANIPRAQTHAQAAALPRGTRFFAPDGSLREIV